MAAEPTALEPITVVVPDAPPPVADDGIPVVTPKAADAERPVKQPKVTAETDQTVDDLRKQVEQANAATTEANRRAAESAAHAQRSQAEAQGSRTAAEQARHDTISTAFEAAKGRMAALKADLKAAMQNGDHDAAVEAQAEMSLIGGRLNELEDEKIRIDEARKNPPPPRVETRQPPADPVETLTAQMSPASAAWVRAHPECATDQRQRSRMLAAHHEALAEGKAVESPEYFAHLDAKFGAQPEADPPPVRQQRERPVAAPPTRGMVPNGVGHDNASSQKVTLTAEMRQTARALDMTDIEYATYLKQARTDGRLN